MGRTGTTPVSERVTLSVDDGEIEEFNFGGERKESDRVLRLTADPKLPTDAVIVAEVEEDLAAEDGDDAFPVDGISVAPTVTNFGNVKLYVCLDPQEPERVETGRYLGAIQVGGPGMDTATVSVTATLKNSAFWPVLFALVGMFVGLLFKALADLSKDPNSELSWACFVKYSRRISFEIAILLGLCGVALSYWQLYDVSEVWGSAEDKFKIFAAGVSLQVTGLTAVDFFKPFSARQGGN